MIEYIPLLLYITLAVFVGVAGIAASSILGPRGTYSKAKQDPYECGVDQTEDPHKPLAIKFFVFALLFILFDIETIFLLPFVVEYKHLIGGGTLPVILVFLTVLGLGLIYIVRTGALEWD